MWLWDWRLVNFCHHSDLISMGTWQIPIRNFRLILSVAGEKITNIHICSLFHCCVTLRIIFCIINKSHQSHVLTKWNVVRSVLTILKSCGGHMVTIFGPVHWKVRITACSTGTQNVLYYVKLFRKRALAGVVHSIACACEEKGELVLPINPISLFPRL